MLSKCIFRSLQHSTGAAGQRIKAVVICFQNVFSVLYNTAVFPDSISVYCCDLLSKCIFRSLQHSRHYFAVYVNIVVICFQNVFSVLYNTANIKTGLRRLRCDLLSKCIFRSLQHSSYEFTRPSIQVVICFQNVFSVLYNTALRLYYTSL